MYEKWFGVAVEVAADYNLAESHTLSFLKAVGFVKSLLPTRRF
jgi:hypothetical protein